jgi:hypothetical protein
MCQGHLETLARLLYSVLLGHISPVSQYLNSPSHLLERAKSREPTHSQGDSEPLRSQGQITSTLEPLLSCNVPLGPQGGTLLRMNNFL